MKKAILPAILALSMTPLIVFAQPGNCGWGYGMMGGGWGIGPYGIFGGLFMIVFWAMLIFGIIYLIRHMARGQHKEGTKDRSGEILNERYAKGELSKEEYEKMKADLKK